MAETINWVAALAALGAGELVRDDVVRTLGALAKTPDDRELLVARWTPTAGSAGRP